MGDNADGSAASPIYEMSADEKSKKKAEKDAKKAR